LLVMKKIVFSLMLLSAVAYGQESKSGHSLIHASEITIGEKQFVVGGLKTLRNYNFNYEIYSRDKGSSAKWEKAGRIFQPGRVEPILFEIDGSLYMAGGWMGTKALDGRVVWLPLKSIWKIFPGEPVKILETEKPIGNATLKQEGSTLSFIGAPGVTELFDLNDVVNKKFPKADGLISVTLP